MFFDLGKKRKRKEKPQLGFRFVLRFGEKKVSLCFRFGEKRKKEREASIRVSLCFSIWGKKKREASIRV